MFKEYEKEVESLQVQVNKLSHDSKQANVVIQEKTLQLENAESDLAEMAKENQVKHGIET